jgi:hypothetical protein
MHTQEALTEPELRFGKLMAEYDYGMIRRSPVTYDVGVTGLVLNCLVVILKVCDLDIDTPVCVHQLW